MFLVGMDYEQAKAIVDASTAPDGLYSGPEEFRRNIWWPDTVPYELMTAQNENGILFRALAEMLLTDFGALPDQGRAKALKETVKRLEKLPGLYNRRPYCTEYEAHDNYNGIMAVGALAGTTEFAQAVVAYGSKNFWNFNNVNPNRWLLKTQRQGGDVAFYKMCAGLTPGWIDGIWWVGAVGLKTWRAIRGSSSDQQLMWLQFRTLRLSPETKFTPIVRALDQVWHTFMEKSFGSYYNSMYEYWKYGAILELAKALHAKAVIL
jgi:hypothetical protein